MLIIIWCTMVVVVQCSDGDEFDEEEDYTKTKLNKNINVPKFLTIK